MTWILISGVVLIGLGMFAAGIASGPRVRDAWWSLDGKLRDKRRERAAAPYAPRHAEALPRRKPLLNRQPWQTSEFPAVAVPEAQRALDPGDGLDEPALTRPYLTDEQTRDLYFTRGLSPDCANGCHAPLCGGRNCSCDYHGKAAPVYWEASQDTVDEAQRAAERVIA